uniref:50S ribosomal protein L21 n=1 Tax=Shumkonia mesophila TaxID=2838854 RepID=UPI002934D13A|nr:50S ribosomal protein L21 [Shumkonia mesophila]
MFAVIKTGGKQYKVSKDDVLAVETLAGAPGDLIQVGDVLMLGEDGQEPTVGAPIVDKAAVFAEVLDQTRGEKIIVFKKQRRQNHRRKIGHRQNLTVLRIEAISPTGEKPAFEAKAKVKAAKPKVEAAEDDGDAPVKAKAKAKAAPKAKAESKAKPKAAAKAKSESKPKAAKSGGTAKAGAKKPAKSKE